MDGVIYHGNQILPGVPEEHFYTSACKRTEASPMCRENAVNG